MGRRAFCFLLAGWNVLLCCIVCFICLKHFVLLYNKFYTNRVDWLILINHLHLQNLNNDKKNIGLKTHMGFLTIVSRSGAWTIVFTIFIIHREVAWSCALQVQNICRVPVDLCGDLEERRKSQLLLKRQRQKKRENQQSSFITLPRILSTNQKHVNVSSVEE